MGDEEGGRKVAVRVRNLDNSFGEMFGSFLKSLLRGIYCNLQYKVFKPAGNKPSLLAINFGCGGERVFVPFYLRPLCTTDTRSRFDLCVREIGVFFRVCDSVISPQLLHRVKSILREEQKNRHVFGQSYEDTQT